MSVYIHFLTILYSSYDNVTPGQFYRLRKHKNPEKRTHWTEWLIVVKHLQLLYHDKDKIDIYMDQCQYDHLYGVMVSFLTTNVTGRGFGIKSIQMKDYEICICILV